jgi:DNA replication protein DnaD
MRIVVFMLLFIFPIIGLSDEEVNVGIETCINSSIIKEDSFGINELIPTTFYTNEVTYQGISSYNKFNKVFRISYTKFSDEENAVAVLDSLLENHYIELSKLETELIFRLKTTIIRLEIEEPFEESSRYLARIEKMILYSYINDCNE